MTKLIASARALASFTVEIEWRDGGRDTIDFGSIIARGRVMSALANPVFFVEALQVEPDGYGLGWPSTPKDPNDVGDIDFSAASLWYRAHPADLKCDLGAAAG